MGVGVVENPAQENIPPLLIRIRITRGGRFSCFVRLQIASNLLPTCFKGTLSIKLELLYALHRRVRQSSSQMTSHLNASPYNPGSHRPPKCIIVVPHPNPGYCRGAKIFWNVEAMRAKEVVAKEKEVAAKDTKANIRIDIVHK